MANERLEELRRKVAEQEERDRTAAEDGSVYVVAAIGTPYVKIGWTKGTVAGRIYDMQVGCPHPLEPIATWPGGRACEAFIHEMLTRFDLHHRAEWFYLPGYEQLRATDGQPAAQIGVTLARHFIETHEGGLDKFRLRLKAHLLRTPHAS